MRESVSEKHLWNTKALVLLFTVLGVLAPACSRTGSALEQTTTPSGPVDTPSSSSAEPQPNSPSPPASSPAVTPVPLDVNDISFLWPVPQTKADVDALISLNDDAADGKLFSADLLGKLMEEAKTVSVGSGPKIQLPDEVQFKQTKTWKVAGIRVNPSALGTNPIALARGGAIPSFRLIVQPITQNGNAFQIHDFTAHIVFLQTLPHPDDTKPFQPDKDAFDAIIKDLREIKAFLQAAGVNTTGQELGVHPGFRFSDKVNEVPGFTDRIRSLLKTHANSKRLGVISFMGVPGKNEPWIFFKIAINNGALVRVPISGNFGVEPKAQPAAQMLSFASNRNGDVVPAPIPSASALGSGFGVGTALLFRQDVISHLDDSLFPNAPDLPGKLKLRHVADFVANSGLRNTGNTDCVSCHTESTRRNNIPGLTAPEEIAFKHPEGISKVAAAVLPKDKWNVRAFGWGFNFFTNTGFKPTVTQRAANEAAESADLINKGFSAFTPTVPQPVAMSDHSKGEQGLFQ